MRRICLIVAALFTMVACSEKGKQFSVTSLYKKTIYSGDTISFEITSKKNIVPDELNFYMMVFGLMSNLIL